MKNKLQNRALNKITNGPGLLVVMIVIALLLSSCGVFTARGSGNIHTELREVSNFNRVVFSGRSSSLRLVQGESEALSVSTDDNILKYALSEVRAGTLYIGLQENELGRGISPSQQVIFQLQVRDIEALEVVGIVDAETGDLETESLRVAVSGVSTLRLGDLDVNSMIVHVTGNSEVEVAGEGQLMEHEIVLSGSGSYNAPGLQSDTVSIDLSGTGSVTVWAVENLFLDGSGSGQLDYFGVPQITQRTAGSMQINSLGTP